MRALEQIVLAQNKPVAHPMFAMPPSPCMPSSFKLPPAFVLGSLQMERGLAINPPCRFQRTTYQAAAAGSKAVEVVLDVAHNPDGLTRLFALLRHHYPSRVLRVIVALTKEKDASECMSILCSHPRLRNIHLVQADTHRAYLVSELGPVAKAACSPFNVQIHTQYGGNALLTMQSVLAAMSTGQYKQTAGEAGVADGQEEVLVMCGSFYVMADARQALDMRMEGGLAWPRDPVQLNEMISVAADASVSEVFAKDQKGL